MKQYNILYLPVILLFIACYGCLVFTVGLFVGVVKFDKITVGLYNYFKDKFYFQILLFLLNVFLWLCIWNYYLHEKFYEFLNNVLK